MSSPVGRTLLFLVGLVTAMTLVLPISNLFSEQHEVDLATLRSSDWALASASQVLVAKCADCHSTRYRLPIYANLPYAREWIGRDIRNGSRFLDLQRALAPDIRGIVSEVTLAKLEYQISGGTMPPARYLMLHWDGGLTGLERDELLQWIQSTRAMIYDSHEVAPGFKVSAVQPLTGSFSLNSEKLALGKRLFHDTRLSGDGSLSCASCHDLKKGGTDQEQFSEGIGGAIGEVNTPTVFNAGYQFRQFWDGRAGSLEDQAKGPITNPREMGADWETVIRRLEDDPEMADAFFNVYQTGITPESVVDSIAEFERSLETPNSRFDQFLTGNEEAITVQEKRGFGVFRDSGCSNCHVGELLGGKSFELMSRFGDYFADRGGLGESDYGRFNVTRKESDRFRFKVPTLRNVALTYPYLHDGTSSELSEVVRIMYRYQLGFEPDEVDVQDLVAFLNTLTGEYLGQEL